MKLISTMTVSNKTNLENVVSSLLYSKKHAHNHLSSPLVLGKDYLAYFSSRGPTFDGRTKPEVLAPGYFIQSASSQEAIIGECDFNETGTTRKAGVELSVEPSVEPSVQPLLEPSVEPSVEPLVQPSVMTSVEPSVGPSVQPSLQPSVQLSVELPVQPSVEPSVEP